MYRDMTDVFRANIAEEDERHLGLYTTIRETTLKNGSRWLLANGAYVATATPIIDGIKRDDLKIHGGNFRDLHVEIVALEGLI